MEGEESTNKVIKKKMTYSNSVMQKLCQKDPTGKGVHCFCIDIDPRQGIKRCCRCNQWNLHGNDWTSDEDFR